MLRQRIHVQEEPPGRVYLDYVTHVHTSPWHVALTVHEDGAVEFYRPARAPKVPAVVLVPLC